MGMASASALVDSNMIPNINYRLGMILGEFAPTVFLRKVQQGIFQFCKLLFLVEFSCFFFFVYPTKIQHNRLQES